jgi:hypothetical protein
MQTSLDSADVVSYDSSTMLQFDPVAAEEILPELGSGESFLWAAQPSLSVTFHREDIYLIPFGLLWGGFAIFWELGVAGYWDKSPKDSGAQWFMLLWGVPFILVGQYLIWGRFLFARWKKRRTFYAVTNRRVIVVQNGFTRRLASSYLDTLPTLMKEGGSKGIGTLRFSQLDSMWSGKRSYWGNMGAWDGMAVGDVPTFRDVEDVEAVYRLIQDQRERFRQGSLRVT